MRDVRFEREYWELEAEKQKENVETQRARRRAKARPTAKQDSCLAALASGDGCLGFFVGFAAALGFALVPVLFAFG